jgi:hypothetical protein
MLMCCVYTFSLHRESLNLILGDEYLLSEMVLSQFLCLIYMMNYYWVLNELNMQNEVSLIAM